MALTTEELREKTQLTTAWVNAERAIETAKNTYSKIKHGNGKTCEICQKSTNLAVETYTCDRCLTKFNVFWQVPVDQSTYNNLKNFCQAHGTSFSNLAQIIHVHEFTGAKEYYPYDMPCANCNPWWHHNTYKHSHCCDCCNPVNH